MTVFDDATGSALYVGGAFTSAGGMPVDRIAKWDGSTWSPLGGGVGVGDSNPAIHSLEVFDDGSGSALYVGGIFSNASGVPMTAGLARWNGTDWSSVGGGVNAAFDLALFDDGSGTALYTAFGSTQAGGNTVNYIAKWDGVAWSALGTGMGAVAYALTVVDDGSGSGPSLFVGGDFTRAGVIQSWAVAKWRACESPIDTFCFGDGTVADCPCSNLGPLERGCQNSIGLGARLTTTGSRIPDTLVFQVTDERPTALTIFLQGNALISSSADFGDGLRCAGGDLKRLYVKSASAGAASAPQPGDPSVTARSAMLGDPIAPGSTRYYQTYYRDPNPNFCAEANGGSTFNSSNGVRVVW